MNIILGITGSVSAYKTPWLVRDLIRAGHHVRVVLTQAATRFVAPLALEATSRNHVVVDPFDKNVQEGGSWHVHLARWADVMLIAPCSATTLAKLATGLSDSSVTLVASSLPKHTPLIVAPAMDTDMWLQSSTQRNANLLTQDGITVLHPQSGELASGLDGQGRLPDLENIVSAVQHALQQGTAMFYRESEPKPLRSTQPLELVITAGPTHEPIDAVRSIVNHSTGTMGFALAEAATKRGFLVTLVSGPVSLPTPHGVHRIDVTTAHEMFETVKQYKSSPVIIMAAAVADFTPIHPRTSKIKKDTVEPEGMAITLQRTTDILEWLGNHKQPTQVLVGFALETENVLDYAKEKLHTKHADMIVANQAGVEHSGFGTGNNTISLVTHTTTTTFPAMSKRACAEVILDAIIEIINDKKAQSSLDS